MPQNIVSPALGKLMTPLSEQTVRERVAVWIEWLRIVRVAKATGHTQADAEQMADRWLMGEIPV